MSTVEETDDEFPINKWVDTVPAYKFFPISNLKLFMLISFFVDNLFYLEGRGEQTPQQWFDFFKTKRRVASRHYVRYKNIIDDMFLDEVDEKKMQEKLKIKTKKEKPAKAKKKSAKTQTNVISFEDYKNTLRMRKWVD
jgi:hypothetical protein